MTTTVIDYDSSTEFNFAEAGDTLVILSDGNVAPISGAAIATQFGEANVTIDGSAVGDIGFNDEFATGHDIVAIGLDGSLIGSTDSGFLGGDDCYITNAGLIDGEVGEGIASGSGNVIVNGGRIYGFYYAIADSGKDNINNSGTLYSQFNQDATIFEGSGDNTIVNSGLIGSSGASEAIILSGESNIITNTGTIDGAKVGVSFENGDDYLSNSGTISGLVTAIQSSGAVGGTVIENTGLVETVQSGGAAIDFGDAGGFDFLSNTGTILGSVKFASGDGAVSNSGYILGNVYFSGDDNVYLGGEGTLIGAVYCSGTAGNYIGGAQGTTFIIEASQLDVTDTIVGGGAGEGELVIQGAGAVTALDLKNVSGMATIGLGASESIVITAALANSAAGHALTIHSDGTDTINLAAVTKASDAITVWAESRDKIIAGASRDTFGFAAADASTGVDYDTLAGVNLARDEFDVSLSAGQLLGIDKAVTSGALSTATFDANLAADLGPKKLGADEAVLFTASAGTLKGEAFLIVDCNDKAGYTAGADLVIRLVGATGTLSLGNFV